MSTDFKKAVHAARGPRPPKDRGAEGHVGNLDGARRVRGGIGRPERRQGRRSSAALTSTAAGDPAARRDDFQNYPMDGCTSLLNSMARVKAGNPSVGMTAANVTAYDDYIKRVVKCPLFNVDMTDRQTIHRDSSDDELINAVADTFDGVEADDKDKIKTSVRIVQFGGEQFWLRQIDRPVRAVGDLFRHQLHPVYSIYIYSSHGHMVDNKSKGHHSMQEDFDVQRTKLTFRINDWPHFATAVWDKQWTSVNDWLDDNNAGRHQHPR